MMPGVRWSVSGHAPHPSVSAPKTLRQPCGRPVVTLAALRANHPQRLTWTSSTEEILTFPSSRQKAKTTLSLRSGRPTAGRIADPVKANSLVEQMAVKAPLVTASVECHRTVGLMVSGKRRAEVGQETILCCTHLVFPCLMSPSRTRWTAVWRNTHPVRQRLTQGIQED